uniref:ATPase n=1 Tax=Chlorobium chlorochromatii (strain CaD3) TaxID=340177 RepID=Q3ASN7_CHLCH
MTIILRLLGLVKPHLWWMVLAALISFATTGSGIGLLMAAAYIIGKAAQQSGMAALELGVIGVRLFSLSRALFRYAERLISHNIAFKVLSRLRLWFYDALEPLAPARLMRFKSGDLLQRIMEDIQSLQNIYARGFAAPLTALLVALLMAALLGAFSPLAGGLMLLFHALAGIGVPLVTHQLSKGVSSGIMRQKAEEQLLALDLFEGVGELQLYGKLPQHLAALQNANQRKLTLERKNAFIERLHESFIGLLMNGALLVMIVTLMQTTTNGALSGIALAVATLAIMASFEPFFPLPASIQHLEADQHAGERLFEILDAIPEITPPASPLPFPTNHTIRAEKLSFSYPESTTPALHNLSFTVQQGEHIALVGPSGAGKSTITSLFMRFWNPSSGSLTIGGTNIANIDPEEVRRNIGLVSQKTYLFAETIRHNLLLAAPHATDGELKAALTAAGLGNFTSQLDEWCGQHGMKLSGGERQRMAIARLLLQNAPIMILDEATANLDGITEQEVTETLKRLAQGKTLITITHRLKGMEQYAQILVLEKGRLVEQGTHESLMAAHGLYRKMWELQHDGGSIPPTPLLHTAS